MTAPVLSLPVKVLRSATAGRRPGDGTFRALTDGEVFLQTADKVLCYLNGAGALQTIPFDPAFFASLAALASPALTGTPTAPTAAAGDNSTSIATTAFVAAAISALVASAPGTLDTLKELADALGDDPNYAATTASALGNRLRVDASQSLTRAQQLQALVNIGAALIGDQPVNLMLSASVASNALTVSVLGANGAAPSAANPVLIPVRDPTATAGDLTWMTVSSALSITVPSGATLGTLSGVPSRVWVVVIDNGGTPVLGVKVCTDGATTIYPLSETATQTAAAIGTGSSTGGTLYATAACTGPIRILGKVEFGSGQATAGTWATAPSAVLRQASGQRRPGDIEQVVTASTTSAGNNNTNAYAGANVQATITPVSPMNPVSVRLSGGSLCVYGVNVSAFLRTTRGTTGNTIGETTCYYYAASNSNDAVSTPVALENLDFPATTAATSYKAQLKNGDNASNVVYPNAGRTTLTLTEYVV